MNNISVISLNVDKGMLNYDKLLAIKQFCKSSDVVLLQETRGLQKETLWKKYLGRKGKFSFFRENSRGVAALVNEKFEVIGTNNDSEGRVASTLIQNKNIKVGAVSFYCPNVNGTQAAKEKFFETLSVIKRHIEDLSKETDYIVAAGDLNIILDAALDAEKPDAVTYPALVEEVFDMLGSCNLADAYRYVNPEDVVYTFSPRGSNPHDVFRRLDYCFVSEALLPYLENITLEHCHFSDHKAVRAVFSFKENTRLRNFWRHNDSLLENEEYIEYMIKAIKEGTKKYLVETGSDCVDSCDPRSYWEFLKYFLGKESRNFTQAVALERNKCNKELHEKLKMLDKNPVLNKEEIIDIKRSLELLKLEEDKKLIFQARVLFTEHNEKPTSFFMRKIKENYRESNILELEKDGKKLSKEECNKEIYSFYKQLYKHRATAKPRGRLKQILEGLPKISSAEAERLKRPITQAEVSTTLFGRMNPGKSPGCDGLTVAFYKKFWDFLKVPLFRCLEASVIRGELTSSQKKSVIRLIQKKGKDPTVLKNWRPISLMNCDAKIFSRLITARLEEVISDLCSVEQLAYIKERNIMEGNRLIDYLISYMEQSGEEGYIMGFDFEKAFDSISHDFLRTVLLSYGFPTEFNDLFNTLYKGAESAVMNNGLTTKYFPLGRSCRQGDCLSPYLFILALEPLIQLIKTDRAIEGFSPNNQTIKVSVYADDMTGFIRDERELVAFIGLIEHYGESSGLKLNVDKTEALHVSPNPKQSFQKEKLRNIKFVRHIKVTGIAFGRNVDRNLTEKLNYEGALNKMRNNFNSWNQRDITILGRVMLAKYHGIAILQYLANNIEVPDWAIAAAKRLIYRFVYRGVDKITRKMASKPLAKGGINLPILDDLAAAAGVQWLRKARVYPERPWARFISRDFRKLGGLGCMDALRPKKDDLKEGILPFNRYLWKCWQRLKMEEGNNEDTLLGQTIWKNRRFFYRQKTTTCLLKSSYLFKKGFTRVGDFFDMDGRIIEAEGDCLRGFPLQARMEWALAVKHIKKYLNLHKFEITKGFSDRHNMPMAKDTDKHEIYLLSEESRTELKDLRQGLILRILAMRRNETTPHFKKIQERYSLNEEELEEHYKNIAQQSFASKMRSFLFKLYAGLVYGNSRLFLFGISDTKSCERCNYHTQDLFHLFLECPEVEKFRQEIYSKIKRNFSKQEELLGCGNSPFTYILLKLNHYIYQRKFLKLPLNTYEFYSSLRTEKNIEEQIAQKLKRTHKYKLKWDKIINTGILH